MKKNQDKGTTASYFWLVNIEYDMQTYQVFSSSSDSKITVNYNNFVI